MLQIGIQQFQILEFPIHHVVTGASRVDESTSVTIEFNKVGNSSNLITSSTGFINSCIPISFSASRYIDLR